MTFSVKPTKAGNLTATATKKLFKVGTAVVADLVDPRGVPGRAPGTPVWPAPPQWRR